MQDLEAEKRLADSRRAAAEAALAKAKEALQQRDLEHANAVHAAREAEWERVREAEEKLLTAEQALHREQTQAKAAAETHAAKMEQVKASLEEAVRGQMHPRMRAPEYASRVSELADKYSLPIREFPDDWDSALLNVYRADQPPRRPLSGRALLAEARAAKERGGARILVATGDADGVVAPRASARVAELLGADEFTTMAETGHLPMDERPEETAKLLLDFFEGA